jgi:peptidoglycan/LPS O-acetylase OafA/YrhL
MSTVNTSQLSSPGKVFTDSPFLNYINNFRGIAIMIIVAYHSMVFIPWEKGSIIYKVLNILLENCTIMFIFISGYLFRHLLPKFTFKSYLKKKFINVISPYLIMSSPAVMFLILNFKSVDKPWIYDTGLMHKSIITDILLLEITGSQWSHFWFIPMMVIFYFMAPVFRFIANHPGIYYILPFLVLISFWMGRSVNNSNPFQSFAYFLPVYLFGAFSNQFYAHVNLFLRRFWYVLLFLFFILSYIIFVFNIYSFSLFQKMILCYLVLALLIKFNDFKMTFLETMAKFSFGIYFIHMYIIYLISFTLSYLGFNFLRSFGIFSYIIFFFLTTFLSYIMLRIIKIITKDKSRMVTGC